MIAGREALRRSDAVLIPPSEDMSSQSNGPTTSKEPLRGWRAITLGVVVTAALLLIGHALVKGSGSHNSSSAGSPPQSGSPRTSRMDQMKALVSRQTGHDESNITCTHDIDYFCKASDRQASDNPDQPLCWKVLVMPGRAPEVLGPMSAYCP
jgi:hypothetical protein